MKDKIDPKNDRQPDGSARTGTNVRMTRKEFLDDLEGLRATVQDSISGIPMSRLVIQMRDQERY